MPMTFTISQCWDRKKRKECKQLSHLDRKEQNLIIFFSAIGSVLLGQNKKANGYARRSLLLLFAHQFSVEVIEEGMKITGTVMAIYF